MVKSKTTRRTLCLLLTLMLLASVFAPVGATADSTLAISQDAEQGSGKTVLTAPRITELAAPKAGSPFPTQATVVTAEGVSWQVAVVWTDENGLPVEGIAGEGPYRPVIVFFVPAGYAVRGSDGSLGGFTLGIDDAVLALFGTDKLFTVLDADRGITYILNGKTDASVARREESTVPSPKIPGLPEQFLAPEDSYRNPNYVEPTHTESADTEPTEAEKPSDTAYGALSASAENPVTYAGGKTTTDMVYVHCAKTALDAMEVAELAELVDLIKYRVQPQAVELLRQSFPAYDEAALNNQLSSQTGFYVYYEKGDKDGVRVHEEAMSDAAAFASWDYEEEEGYLTFKHMIGVNARYLVEMDENANPIVDESTGKARFLMNEKNLADLENTIIHEMMHVFMYDYNRVGMTGSPGPELLSGEALGEADAAERDRLVGGSGFPEWLKEGLATAVQNNYAYRYNCFNLLSYAGEGKFSEWYTPEVLRGAYSTMSFRTDLNEPPIEYCCDLENKKCDVYVSGYLACLYLGELAANKAGSSSAYMGEDGYYAYKSDVIRDGINTVLKRLHDGETLDAVIEDISDGAFTDTKEFEKNFIKGDEDSSAFCAGYLNYMRALSQDENRQYLPNGSILYPFDWDYDTPLDRTKDGESRLYQIVDSANPIGSTADLNEVSDGGRSVSYDDYKVYLGVMEEERMQFAAQHAVIDEIVNAVLIDGGIDPAVYDYIVDAVVGAQIVDEETRDDIILKAWNMAAENTGGLAEGWDENLEPDALAEGWDEELGGEDGLNAEDWGDGSYDDGWSDGGDWGDGSYDDGWSDGGDWGGSDDGGWDDGGDW